MRLGVHVSIEGKIYESFDQAKRLGCNTIQIFSRSPQRWRGRSLNKGDIKEFNRRRQESGIKPVFIHIPYMINLASPEADLYKSSIKAYVEDILEADSLKADYIVTHMGSHKKTSEAEGIKRLIKALNIILEKTKDTQVGILLENTTGSGSWLGYNFIHQQQVIQGIKHKERVGLCFDTAHAYLAGYDISTEKGLESVIDEIDKLLGVELIKLIHLNDARDKLGSKYDRHESIGKGMIGIDGMKRIINHPRLRNIPFILETPKKTAKEDIINLKIVKKLRQP